MKFPFKKFSITKQVGTMLVLASFVFSNAVVLCAMSPDDKTPAVLSPAVAKYVTDLTQLGREGRLRENLNLEAETLQLIKVLGGNGSRQPMILDEKNEAQDTLVEQLAIRIANGSVPALSGKRILKLEAPTLFSHSKSVHLFPGLNDFTNDHIANIPFTEFYSRNFVFLSRNKQLQFIVILLIQKRAQSSEVGYFGTMLR